MYLLSQGLESTELQVRVSAIYLLFQATEFGVRP